MDSYFETNGALDFSKVPPSQEIQDTVVKTLDNVRDHEKIMCAVSGGYDSDIVLDLLVRCGAKEKTTFVFNDTGLEHEATKKHLSYLEQQYGISIKWLKPKKAIPTCCREYGVPFWSKYVSSMIYRLQKHRFQWEDEPLDVLLKQYPNCRSALRWWTNDFRTESGQISRFNIEYVSYLKEFLIWYKPEIKISSLCCEYAKKVPAHNELKNGGYDLNCTGIRKSEGGQRSTVYKSCFDLVEFGADNFRPLFYWADSDKDLYREFFRLKRSDCYEVWGMDRTGCAGCPFGKEFEKELSLVEKYEPPKRKLMEAVFGDSYKLTREFLNFRKIEKGGGVQMNLFDTCPPEGDEDA